MQVKTAHEPAGDEEDFLKKHIREAQVHLDGSDVELAEHLIESPKRWEIAIALVAIGGLLWALAPTVPFYP
jgi:hypothetical protein